jgi:hypothetical protein
VSAAYADWKAPAEDGQWLIWPEAGRVLADARENAARLARAGADSVRIQGLSLAEVRSAAREFLGHREGYLVASGHQAELYHPGVWVKDVLSGIVARRIGGEAYHLAIDSDAPKHLHLRWPGGGAIPITDDERITSAAWTALLAAPTPQHLSYVQANFDEAVHRWALAPVIEPFFGTMRRVALETPDLASALVNATHALDWELGLRHHALLASPMWMSEAYLVYVHHVAGRVGEFAAQYNAALAGYRREHGIRTSARPMPDLRVSDEEVELPFWADDVAGGSRGRLVCRHVGGNWRVVDSFGGEGFDVGADVDGWEAARRLLAWCRQRRLRLTPRALTLTLFLRLMVADQFVHGIGGGRYDQVTDEVIRRFFGIEPPRFCVTTATLYFPAAVGERRVNVAGVIAEGRRARHGALGERKRELVTAIEAAPRRSRRREELFFEMHREMAGRWNGAVAREWDGKAREAETQAQGQKELFDRELFYAIQPRERLIRLIERYDAQIL